MKNNNVYRVVGLILLSLLLYNIFHTHIPKTIKELDMYLIVFSFIIYSIKSILLFMKIIKLHFLIPSKPNTFFQKIYQNYIYAIINLIDLSYKYLDSYIKDNILGPLILGSNLKKLMNFLLNNIGSKHSSYKLLFIIFDIIPKLIIILIFCVDTIILDKLEYIYIFSWIILIPLTFKYIIFTLREFTEYNIVMILDKYLLIKSNVPAYFMNADDIIKECCCQYRQNIYEQCPQAFLDRTIILVCNIGKTYILQESFTSKYESADLINKVFDDIMFNFNCFRNLREIVYQIEKMRFYWKYLYFEFSRLTFYSLLWMYIYYVCFF